MCILSVIENILTRPSEIHPNKKAAAEIEAPQTEAEKEMAND